MIVSETHSKMPEFSWHVAADGRYWLDVALANIELSAMIDIGLVDSTALVGFEVEPAAYKRLKQAGHLSAFRMRSRRDAAGRVTYSECGLGTAQLIDPATRQRVGPATRLYFCCGAAGLPTRVGVVIFHSLRGCNVDWDLGRRIWKIKCP